MRNVASTIIRKVEDLDNEERIIDGIHTNGFSTYTEDEYSSATGNVIKKGKYYSVTVTLLYPVN